MGAGERGCIIREHFLGGGEKVSLTHFMLDTMRYLFWRKGQLKSRNKYVSDEYLKDKTRLLLLWVGI